MFSISQTVRPGKSAPIKEYFVEKFFKHLWAVVGVITLIVAASQGGN
jgi:hypothetical protein